MLEKTAISSEDTDPSQREYLYRQVAKQFPNGGVAVFDRDFRFIIFEGSGVYGVNLTPEFAQGKTLRQIFSKEIADVSEPLYAAALEGRSTTVEIPYLERIFRIEHAPIEDTDGNIEYGMVMAQDITEQKTAEQALRDSELELRALFSAMTDIIMVLDKDGRYLKIAPTKAKFITASPQDLIGNRVRDFFNADKADLAELTIRRTLETGETQKIEYDIQIEDDLIWFEAMVSPRTENSVFWVARDITQFKQIESAQKKSQKHLRNIIDGLVPDMFIGLIQPDGILIEVNKAPLSVAGIKFEEVLGKPFDQTYWWSFSENSRKQLRDSIARAALGESLRYDVEIRVGDEEFIQIDFVIQPLRDEFGNIQYLIASGTVITERKKAEEALQESQQKYKELVENINDVIFSTNVLCQVTYISPIIQSLTGYSSASIQGVVLKEMIVEEDREYFKKLMASALIGNKDVCECRMKLKKGSFVWVQISTRPILRDGNVVGTAGVIADITKRRQLEQQLFQTQNLESLGTLAGGIAHDFNNLLGIMACNLSILEDDFADPKKKFKSADAISKTIRRGANLVEQLLTIARKGDMTLKLVQMNSIVYEMVNLMEETFSKLIEIDLSVGNELPSILADQSQIHQVLLNLCVNARDALEPNGGKISLGTKAVFGEELKTRFENAEAEVYIELTVSDTGAGMDPLTKSRIFEPFFTTKEPGKGTGLGLATTYGILERHRGFIEVESAIGSGTTFRVYLPAQSQEIENELPEKKIEEIEKRASGTIFFVEDEEMLKEVFTCILEKEGYRVLNADNGWEAVKLYRQKFQEIDLVLSDVGLPGLEGDQMFYEMKKINPSIRAILSSGFIEPNNKTALLKSGVIDVLQKPYVTTDILKRIKNAIQSEN
ncbi:PAS domain S-box protein [Leptospira sp. 201903070]|jgi:PAS domain S-box-containing protein|uniref:histidine kinase n=1 Tax=Leptospira ainlahdjerensis TaxID=2810033 RepID=A0ABS2U633_9LEPT|nr:PAS domain-containing sensor histidine kinase [Leptospira ainlahdjerensis]MBM9575826.1 PAS domain S-box protein [Leptospira ainlahdjerensis]